MTAFIQGLLAALLTLAFVCVIAWAIHTNLSAKNEIDTFIKECSEKGGLAVSGAKGWEEHCIKVEEIK